MVIAGHDIGPRVSAVTRVETESNFPKSVPMRIFGDRIGKLESGTLRTDRTWVIAGFIR